MPKSHSSAEIFIFIISKFLNLVTRKSALLQKCASLKQYRIGMDVFLQKIKLIRKQKSFTVMKSLAENTSVKKKKVIFAQKINTMQ